jgi:hypothetical protein
MGRRAEWSAAHAPVVAVAIPLLLLIHPASTHPVALRVCSAHGDRAALPSPDTTIRPLVCPPPS